MFKQYLIKPTLKSTTNQHFSCSVYKCLKWITLAAVEELGSSKKFQSLCVFGWLSLASQAFVDFLSSLASVKQRLSGLKIVIKFQSFYSKLKMFVGIFKVAMLLPILNEKRYFLYLLKGKGNKMYLRKKKVSILREYLLVHVRECQLRPMHKKCSNLYFYAPRKISGEHIVVALSVRPSVSQSVRPSVRTYVPFVSGP